MLITCSWQRVGPNLLESKHLQARDTSEPGVEEVCSLMQEREEFGWDECSGLTGCGLQAEGRKKKHRSANDGAAHPVQAEAEGLVEQRGACLPERGWAVSSLMLGCYRVLSWAISRMGLNKAKFKKTLNKYQW